MTLLQLLGYVSDAAVLITYAVLATTKRERPFHWANALGAAPLLYAEILAGLWQVLILTASFCALGWVGLWKTRKGVTDDSK